MLEGAWSASRAQARQTIALVGLPGSGKSTVGRLLANRLGRVYVDSDSVIEERLGCSIKKFFETEGEDAFRLIEGEVLAELVTREGCVIATGGGMVLREANRQLLRDTTHVFYLRAKPDDLYRRLKKDTKRPLLQVSDPLARLHELHAIRDPLYAEIAEFVADTGNTSASSLVAKLVSQLELAGLIAPPPPA